jgi:hypothetical protein
VTFLMAAEEEDGQEHGAQGEDSDEEWATPCGDGGGGGGGGGLPDGFNGD